MYAKLPKIAARFAKHKKSGGRVDAPGVNSTVRNPNEVAMGVLKRKALQGSGGSYLQGSTPNLQGVNSGSTRRLQ